MDSVPDAAHDFNLRKAVETIDRATSYDAPLRRRTEGVTWMVWGLVGALTLLLYAAGDFNWRIWYLLVGVGWPVLGIVSTSAVWRIAALSRPALRPHASRLAWAVPAAAGILIVATLGAYWLYELFGSYAAVAGVAVALPWLVLTLTQWERMSAEGRRMSVLVGTVAVAAGVTYATAASLAEGEFSHLVFYLAVTGVVPFAAGLWHTLRS